MMKFASTSALLIGLAISTGAAALEVRSGDAMVIDFHLPYSADPMLKLHPTDTVYLALGAVAPASAVTGLAALFNGNELLGIDRAIVSAEVPGTMYFYWTATGSGFTHSMATTINGTALADRSIAGQIRVTFDDDFSFGEWSMDAGNGFGRSIGMPGGTQAVVDGIRVAPIGSVPEPAAWSMMALGALALSALSCVRRRN